MINKKKYVVLIGDGMADRPLEELGMKTPLMVAHTPNMNLLAKKGVFGIVKTIPDGLHPGSDVANLSIMGYDPRKYYTGRAPLEAASIGVNLSDEDVAYRCNLVTLKFDKTKTHALMEDYSSGHISTEEAKKLVASLKDELESDDIIFYSGVSYRHLMVWKKGSLNVDCVAPHDILEKDITDYLPVGERDYVLRELMRRSVDILERHPVNLERIKNGKRPANSIWLWGQGKRPMMPTYQEKYGIKGALVSAVDLTKGLGIYAGFRILKVPGVTGWLDTNYLGKAEYSLKALEEVDFVYIHVESPDEAGHSGNYKDKIKAIEDFDKLVVGTMLEGLKKRFKNYRILLMPDHATPLKIRTHTDDPVPFVIYDSSDEKNNSDITYDESIINRKDVLVINEGHMLMDLFIKGG